MCQQLYSSDVASYSAFVLWALPWTWVRAIRYGYWLLPINSSLFISFWKLFITCTLRQVRSSLIKGNPVGFRFACLKNFRTDWNCDNYHTYWHAVTKFLVVLEATTPIASNLLPEVLQSQLHLMSSRRTMGGVQDSSWNRPSAWEGKKFLYS